MNSNDFKLLFKKTCRMPDGSAYAKASVRQANPCSSGGLKAQQIRVNPSKSNQKVMRREGHQWTRIMMNAQTSRLRSDHERPAGKLPGAGCRAVKRGAKMGTVV
jgi:hypothetical protein